MTLTHFITRYPAHISRRAALTGGALIAVIAVSTHATFRAIAAPQLAVAVPLPSRTGYEAEDHFPGAAYLYAADDHAAPASGATGTAALPDLPIPTDAIALSGPPDRTVTAAQPFSTRLASAIDRGRALECLTAALYYEAASEADDGERAIAQVILNRVRHPAFPATICGVVYQGTDRPSGCQFSYACDGSMARIPSKPQWNRALHIAAAALNGSVFAPVGEATHYHTYAVTPAWNRSLVMTAAVGAHFFHRWQGYWGTPQAFRQIYRGGEPVPGPAPHPLVAALPTAEPVAPAAAPGSTKPLATPAPSSAVAAARIQPAYVQSGTPLSGYNKPAAPTAASGRADESQILDRWQDSGKPLR